MEKTVLSHPLSQWDLSFSSPHLCGEQIDLRRIAFDGVIYNVKSVRITVSLFLFLVSVEIS